MSKSSDPDLYESALDLPSVVGFLEVIRSAKALTRVIGRKHRGEIKQAEKQIQEMYDLVDRFYDLLSDRHWIFTDDLNVEKVAAILDADISLDQAEQRFIGLYQDFSALSFKIMRLHRLPAMRDRLHLIEKARADYEAGRYYATVQVLLSVMDGFVNDFERDQRRGLHTREVDEMAAWDSVVGHHRGLAHAHATYIKGFYKTSTEEVVELYRNGIVHGMLVNYDNVIVATKAWNRLFAVADWAISREKQREPAEPERSLLEVFTETVEDMRKLDIKKKLINEWQPSVLTKGDDGLEDEEAFTASVRYLSGWQKKNYKQMADLITPQLTDSNPRRMAGQVKDECILFDELVSFEITRLSFEAPAICEVDALLTFKDETKPARLRWIREHEGAPAVPGEPGYWHLIVWGPVALFNRAEKDGS